MTMQEIVVRKQVRKSLIRINRRFGEEYKNDEAVANPRDVYDDPAVVCN